MTNSNFLKKLLTTASVIAVSASAGNAFAAEARITTGGAATQAGVNLEQTNIAKVLAPAPVTTGSTITFDGAHIYDAGGANAVNLAGVKANGNFVATIDATAVGKNFTIGSVTRGAGATGIVNINLDNATEITFTGKSTAALVYIANLDKSKNPGKAGANWNFATTANDHSALGKITLNHNADKVTFNSDAVLSKAIHANAAGNGVVVANGLVNFNAGITGGVGALNIQANKSATLGAASNVNVVTIGNKASLNVANNVNITSKNIKGAAAKQGNLIFSGSSIAAVTKVGDVQVLKAVELNGAGTVNFSKTTNFDATTTTLNHADAVIQFGTKVEINTNFVTTGGGKIITKGNTAITGSIGTSDETFSEVQVAGGKFLTISGKDIKLYADNITATTANKSQLFLDSNAEIHSNIGAGNKFLAVGIFNKVAAINTVKLMGKNITSSFTSLTINKAVDNVLELHDGSSITGNVITDKNGKGILSIQGDSKIDGAIIANVGNIINQLRFDSASTLVLSKNKIETANGINFKADGTLRLTQNKALTFDKAITVAKSATGSGSIILEATNVANVHTFQGKIGNAAKTNESLKLLEMKAKGEIVFEESAAIKKIEVGTFDSRLTLNKAAGEFLIGDFSHSDAKGIIIIKNDSTLKEGTNLSAGERNTLSSISIIGNKTLTVENGVNLYTENTGIRNSVAGKGTIIFTGNSRVGANLGTDLIQLKTVQVTGNGKTVDFLNKVNLANDLTISKGATAVLRSEVRIGGAINGANAGEGTLRLANSEAFTTATLKPILTRIGQVNRLDTIEIAGRDLTFINDEFNTNNLNFTSPGNTTITFEADMTNKLDDTTITSNSTTRAHNIVFAKSANAGAVGKAAGAPIQIFNTNIGTANNPFGDITLLGNDLIAAKGDFYAGLVNSKNQEGVITFIKNNGVALNLGTKDSELLGIGVLGNTTFNENVYSKDIVVFTNKTATFKKSVSGSENMFLDANSVAIFEGTNTNIDIAIDSKVAGRGRVNLFGTTNINKAIGNLNNLDIVHFTNGSTTNITANIAATRLNVDGSINIAQNADLSGATTFNDSIINLGSNNITLKDGISRFTGNDSINVTLNDNKELGSITVDAKTAPASLNAQLATSLITYITDAAPLPSADENYTLIKSKNGGVITNFAANKLVTLGNKFVNWSTSDGINGTRQNIAASVVTNILGTADSELLNDTLQFVNVNNTGDARAYATELGRMSTDRLQDSVKRSTEQNSVHANEMATNLMDSQTATINNRMGAFSNHPQPGVQLASSDKVSGVSAGEGDHTMYGAWVSPFYSQTTQKARGSRAGYESDSYGATVGFDTQANADLTLGLAGTYAKTDAKHKNFKSGDKTETDTFMFSVYGIQQLTNDWFLQGHAAYATNSVKSSEKLISATTNPTAKADYDVTSYNTELLAGLNCNLAQVVVTPLAGASYTRVNSSGYTETGTTNQNRIVSTKATNRFEAIAGLRAQMTTEVEGINVTPEIHGFVKHDLIGKSARVTSKISGMVNSTSKSAKALKTTYNVGLGVNAVSGMYEYGAGYDLFAGDKTIGHQGTLKVRVNF